MRKISFLLILALLSPVVHGQIVADHTVVDLYDDIPQQYLDEVKKMLVSISGESHSGAYRIGQELLELMDDTYQVETYDGDPPAYSNQYLRIGRNIRIGEDYFFSQSRIDEYKNYISAQNNTGNTIDVMGFGWCWDMTWKNDPGGTEDPVHLVHWAGASKGGPDGSQRWGLDPEDNILTGNSVNMETYFAAVEQYMKHCTDNDYPTRWIYTTGPVDGNGGTENGFQREIKHDYIRDYVLADESRILFDYADILCWNNSGEQNIEDWDDAGTNRSHANIHPDNLMDYDDSFNIISWSDTDLDHIGEVGAVRIAKAMWWMLARMAGWNENTSGVNESVGPSSSEISIAVGAGMITIAASEKFLNGQIKLFDLNGRLIEVKDVAGDISYIDSSTLQPGSYVIVVSKDQRMEARNVILAD